MQQLLRLAEKRHQKEKTDKYSKGKHTGATTKLMYHGLLPKEKQKIGNCPYFKDQVTQSKVETLLNRLDETKIVKMQL